MTGRTNFEKWYEALVSDTTNQAFALLCQPGVSRCYLYARPSTAEERGTLSVRGIDDDDVKGLTLVTPQPISGFWSRTKIRQFIWKHGRTAPIVAHEADYR